MASLLFCFIILIRIVVLGHIMWGIMLDINPIWNVPNLYQDFTFNWDEGRQKLWNITDLKLVDDNGFNQNEEIEETGVALRSWSMEFLYWVNWQLTLTHSGQMQSQICLFCPGYFQKPKQKRLKMVLCKYNGGGLIGWSAEEPSRHPALCLPNHIWAARLKWVGLGWVGGDS